MSTASTPSAPPDPAPPRRLTRFQLQQQQKKEEDDQNTVTKQATQENRKRKKSELAKSRALDEVKRPYKVENSIPSSDTSPDYSLLTKHLSVRESKVFEMSQERSRISWLTGHMFKKYWTRPPRGRKLVNSDYANKMTRLCECEMILGPHTFEIKTFVVEDPNPVDVEQENPPPDNQPTGPSSGPTTIEKQDKSSGDLSKEQATSREDAPVGQNQSSETTQKAPVGSSAPPIAGEPSSGAPPPAATAETQKPPVPTAPASHAPPILPATARPQVAPPPPAVQPATAFANLPPRAPGRTGIIYIPYPHFDPSNPATIQKLQYMAHKDAALNNLMRIVASGSASPQQIAAFKKCIANAEKMPTPAEILSRLGYAYYPATLPNAKNQASKNTQKRPLKNIMLVFEFKDNPNDRFVLSKDSILEVLPSGQVLLSFLAIFDLSMNKLLTAPKDEKVEKASPKISSPKKKQPVKYFPLSLMIQNFPARCLSTFERCVNKPDNVRKRMVELMKTGHRLEKKYVWYQIDKTDSTLQEELANMPIMPEVSKPTAKRTYKPRQKKTVPPGSQAPSQPSLPSSTQAPSSEPSIPNSTDASNKPSLPNSTGASNQPSLPNSTAAPNTQPPVQPEGPPNSQSGNDTSKAETVPPSNAQSQVDEKAIPEIKPPTETNLDDN